VVRTVVRLVSPKADDAGLSLEAHMPDVPPLLFCDRLKLKQILLNLLSNAVKFTPAGGTISVSVEIDAERGFIIEVKDTGIGIAEADIPRVLQPFVQVDSALSRAHNGTGLGLPLVSVMTELHGGTLELESEVGKGTMVRACFPAARIVGIADIIPAALGPIDLPPAAEEPMRQLA
jgi:signal transduction histidine kinase